MTAGCPECELWLDAPRALALWRCASCWQPQSFPVCSAWCTRLPTGPPISAELDTVSPAAHLSVRRLTKPARA
jgi:hypothetical protein